MALLFKMQRKEVSLMVLAASKGGAAGGVKTFFDHFNFGEGFIVLCRLISFDIEEWEL